MLISFVFNCLVISFIFSTDKKIGRSYQQAKQKAIRFGMFLSGLAFGLSYFNMGSHEDSAAKSDPFLSLLIAGHEFALWMAAIFAVSMYLAANQKQNKD